MNELGHVGTTRSQTNKSDPSRFDSTANRCIQCIQRIFIVFHSENVSGRRVGMSKVDQLSLRPQRQTRLPVVSRLKCIFSDAGGPHHLSPSVLA